MANKDAAFGLKPVRMLSGVSNFTTNEYPIASGATGPIYQGMLVIMDAGGGGDILLGTNTADDILRLKRKSLAIFILEVLLLLILLLRLLTIQIQFLKFSVTEHSRKLVLVRMLILLQ